MTYQVGEVVEVVKNCVNAINPMSHAPLLPGDKIRVYNISGDKIYYLVGETGMQNYIPIKDVKKIITNQVEIRFRQ